MILGSGVSRRFISFHGVFRCMDFMCCDLLCCWSGDREIDCPGESCRLIIVGQIDHLFTQNVGCREGERVVGGKKQGVTQSQN